MKKGPLFLRGHDNSNNTHAFDIKHGLLSWTKPHSANVQEKEQQYSKSTRLLPDVNKTPERVFPCSLHLHYGGGLHTNQAVHISIWKHDTA